MVVKYIMGFEAIKCACALSSGRCGGGASSRKGGNGESSEPVRRAADSVGDGAEGEREAGGLGRRQTDLHATQGLGLHPGVS